MPSDWFLLGLLGSGAGAALSGIGSAATGLGATGVGSALSSAGTGLSAAAAPVASSGALLPSLGTGSTASLPGSMAGGMLGPGGTGAGTGSGRGPLLPSTPAPSMDELTQSPMLSGGTPSLTTPPYPSPPASTSIGSSGGGAGGFLSSLLPSTSQLQRGGLDLIAGNPSLGGYGDGPFLSQVGNALKTRLLTSFAGGNQQMDPQTAAVLRYLMTQRGLS